MSRALLDVNVLLALFDADHADHRRAWESLYPVIETGWASCPLTQNGFVRVISQPKYPNAISPSRAIRLLGDACETRHHEFWPDDASLLDSKTIRADRVHGPRQVTDVYLLALAAARDGRLITFDDSIPITAVPLAAGRHLLVL
ncbi:MAG: TA system VapC family ribonuclease toxin [Nocardioides sp.]